jgi:hypothetical protein
MERLRYVARAEGAPAPALIHEAAAALGSLGGDPAAVVTACRRLVDRHPGLGPMWWLSARVLCSSDPESEAWQAASELERDPTPSALAAHLPESATVVVVGWPEQAASALRQRGDVRALALGDSAPVTPRIGGSGRPGGAGRSGGGQARRARSSRLDLVEVPWAALGSAVTAASLVLLDTEAAGPSGLLAEMGSLAAAAAGRALGVTTWAVAGVGRLLPARLWEALLARHEAQGEDLWARRLELVPAELVDRVVGPGGPEDWSSAHSRAFCPVAPELLRWR